MVAVRIDLEEASSTELVAAARAINAELAARTAPATPTTATEDSRRGALPESGAVAKELAESLWISIDLAEAAVAGLVRRVELTGEVGRWGLASASAWLRGLGMRPHRAKERLALSRELERLPNVADQFTRGDLSYGYAATICQAVHNLNDADTAKAENILLDLSAKVSVGKVAVAARRITDLIAERDGTHTDPDSAHGYDHSWLQTTKALDGGKYLHGYLNPEDTAAWDGIIAPLAKPAGTDDRRDTTQRTAAALMTALTKHTVGTRALVILNLDTLTGGPTPARLPDDTPIPAAQARRLALNAGVSTLILGDRNIPLYLGNHVRLATPHQRRVLTALYGTCTVKGCEIPSTLCEIDHIHGYALGNSPTNIDQLMPLCRWHNQFKNNHPHRVHTTTHPDTGLHTTRILPPRSPNALKPNTPATPATTPARPPPPTDHPHAA